MEAQPRTDLEPDYGSDEFWAAREYDAGGQKIVGRDAAVDYLYNAARDLAWTDEGLTPPGKIQSGQRAVVMIGAPASGKSSVANPYARAINAAIVDADEAKKIIPEYRGGIGANAVHEESGELTDHVLSRSAAAGDNLVLPKVGASPASIEFLTKYLQSNGYHVDIVLVDIPGNEAWRRMIGRYHATGRVIPPAVMERGIDGAPKTYEALKQKGVADGFAKIDNTPAPGQPRRIEEDDAGIIPADVGRDGRDGASAHEADPGRTRQPEVVQEDLEFSDQDMTMELPDGSSVSLREVLEDLEADEAAEAVIDACTLGGKS